MSTPGSDETLDQLRAHVREVIERMAPADTRGALSRLLSKPGYALHPDGSCRAGLLSLLIHAAIGREATRRTALLSAAAVELQMEAAYVFDEVADSPPNLERSEDLALAISLLMAGVAAATDAAARSEDGMAALESGCVTYVEACAGQFLDAHNQRYGVASLEEALHSTCLKAGALGRFVAGFAARTAGADREGVSLFEQFGFHTFTCAQILDDLDDAFGSGEASDWAQHKATLPVVFHSRNGERAVSGDDTLLTASGHPYAGIGATLYGSIVALAYMERAHEDLALLRRHGYAVEGLHGYVERVDSLAAGALSSLDGRLVT